MDLVKSYKGKEQISEKLKSLISKDSLSSFIQAYKELKMNRFNEFNFDPNTLNGIAIDFYRQKDMDSALELLRLNVKEYPWSPLTHSNFGEINLEMGHREIAMKHLETAFKIHKGYSKWREELNNPGFKNN